MYAKVITKEYFNYTAGGDISNNLKDIVDNLENLYPSVELKNNGRDLFQKPRNVSGLKFGYICPGAIKTVRFLNKNAKSENSKKKVDKIKKYTDALFFVEIIVIYKNYISNSLYKDSMIIIDDSCALSNKLTQKISELFASLPNYLKNNLPDDFYHIRHDTLICSNSKELARKRINMLTSFYESKEGFTNGCIGKRDGVSGCRNCCSKKYSNNYNNCVDNCMRY